MSISIVLPVEARTLISFISQAMEQKPEVPLIACVSPVEIAAEKLSALTWRVLSRDRSSQRDDPSLTRHLYDLKALNQVIINYPDFSNLVFRFMREDIENNRGRLKCSAILEREFLQRMLHELELDPIYQDEYLRFVTGMSYSAEDQRPTFKECIKNIHNIITTFN